jgi:hypothetical protein
MTDAQLASYTALATHASTCSACRPAVLPYGIAVSQLCPQGLQLSERHVHTLALSYQPTVVSTPTPQDIARAAIAALGVPLDDNLDVYNDDLGALPELWKFAHRVAAAQARRRAAVHRAESDDTGFLPGYRAQQAHTAAALLEFAALLDKEVGR